MRKRRVRIKPDFEAEIDLKEAIGNAIAEGAERNRMSYQEYQKKNPVFLKYVIKEIVSTRTNHSVKNIGKFFTHLYAGIFGGEVNQVHFNALSRFYTDVSDVSDLKEVHTEVKGVSVKSGSPTLACFQFARCCGLLYKLAQSGFYNAEMNYAIFRYGKGHENAKLYRHNHQGLSKELSKGIKSLLVVPLNVLIPILLNTSFRTKNHGSSQGRDEEPYWEPHGGLINKIHESPEAVDILFEDAEKAGFSLDNLCAGDLERQEFTAPENAYLGRYKVMPFRVTKYVNRHPEKWARRFFDETCIKTFDFFNIGYDFLKSEKEPEESKELETVLF